jgi:hypothetical protein
MSTIYKQHDAAFSRVSAYVVTDNGEQVAKVAFKFPADGAGRVFAYVHWLGCQMQRGFASGGGYDKQSAAVCSAARKIREDITGRDPGRRAAFLDACWKDDGYGWRHHVESAGFKVWQAV